jgi:hypothetical protein
MGDPCPTFQAPDFRSLESGEAEAMLRHRIRDDIQQTAQDKVLRVITKDLGVIMEDCMFLRRMIAELEIAREIVGLKLYEIITSEVAPYI